MAENFPDLVLNDGSKPLEANKNDYFLVTITDLIPGKTYPVEFRWNYKDPKEKADWGAVLNIVTSAESLPAVSSIVPAWSGTKFTLTFTSNPNSLGNENLLHYEIILNSGSSSVTKIHLPKAGSTQFYQVEVSKFSSPFNTAVNAISGSITAVDKNNNKSSAVSFPLTTRTSTLTPPVITATAINNGYSVSYTTPTAEEYSHIEIEEVESNASTDPGTGYTSSFIGIANPATVIVSSLNKRWVRAKFWDNGGLATAYSTAVSVTPTTPITIDTTPPAAPASGSVTAGIDTSSGSTVGFNAYLDISWSAVSDATLKGYRIRFRKSGSSDPYGYVDSPGTGTTFRLNGLSIGVTYEVAIASYDEFNNTTGTYTSLGTGSAGGTPYIGKNVSTTGYFEAAPSGEIGAFRFGYGVESGKRGLTFNSNNYWYIDSSASASFKLGGSTANYISWDGSTFIVDGNIRAKGGYFAGQLEMQAGAGIYSGTVVSNSLTSDGFLLNTNGLIIKRGSVSLRLDTSDGGVYAQRGTIGNWNIDTNTISSPSGNVPKITLNSSTSQIIASSSTYSAGLAIPEADSGSAIVFWAGNAGRSTSSKFYVTADGNINSSGGTIGGWTIGSTTLSGGSTTLNSNGTISGASVSAATISGSTITGGLLTTGSTGARIQISGSDQGTNPNSITFTNPSGTPISYIVPMNVGGTQYGLLMHYGSTADQSGGSYPQFYLGSINAAMSSRQFAGGPSALVSVDYQLGVTLQTNSTDININGPAKFSSTMFAPNLSTSSSATNLRVTTGTVGEIQETSASSIRFKESIENLPIVGEISAINLLNLPVRSFVYKEGYLSESDDRVQKVLPGFIAEEVEQFYPIAVDYSEGQPHSWNERFIIPGMLALIQNLNQELINVKSRLDALEG